MSGQVFRKRDDGSLEVLDPNQALMDLRQSGMLTLGMIIGQLGKHNKAAFTLARALKAAGVESVYVEDVVDSNKGRTLGH